MLELLRLLRTDQLNSRNGGASFCGGIAGIDPAPRNDSGPAASSADPEGFETTAECLLNLWIKIKELWAAAIGNE